MANTTVTANGNTVVVTQPGNDNTVVVNQPGNGSIVTVATPGPRGPIGPGRYEFLTYTFHNNSFVNDGFKFDNAITHDSNWNFNYSDTPGHESITNNISKFHIDIVNLSTNDEFLELGFSDVTSMQAFVDSKGITSGRITLYAHLNDTSNLRLGGTNQFSTVCTYYNGVRGKVPSEVGFANSTSSSGKINYDSDGIDRLKTYLNNNFFTDLSNAFTNPGDIITQTQIQTLLQSNKITFIRFNKFQKRKLSKFYIQTPWVVLPDETTTAATSFKNKIIASCLMRFTYNTSHGLFLIQPVAFSKPYYSSNSNSVVVRNESTSTNRGFFNIYILQDTVNDGRSIAIEFVSIDAISVPFTIAAKNTNNKSWVYFMKKNNTLRQLTPIPKIDIGVYTEFIPIGGLAVKKIRKNHTSTDIIRLYSDKTCDVFRDNIKLEYSTYEASGWSDRTKAFYFKLNKS